MIDKSNSKKNTKKRIKSEIVDSSRGSGAFFLQKYEVIIMLLGAGIISVLIFFVFLKPSGDNNQFASKSDSEPVTVEDFQEQIDRLANMVEKSSLKENKKSKNTTQQNKSPNISYDDHEKRIERIEASLSIKYETLAGRINRLESSIEKLSRKLDSYKKAKATPVKVVKKPLVKTSKKSKTKKAVVKKKESIFHTVKKGDTLYSLSKQYGTSVTQLEKINHLPKNANIYPGDNLLVK
jgi:LysM repeat protein